MIPVKRHVADHMSLRSEAEYAARYATSVQESEVFWAGEAARLDWFAPWRAVRTGSGPGVSWFASGQLNVAWNCLDRHSTERWALAPP